MHMENNHLSQADEIVPSRQEELSISEQEPDPEVSFHQFRPPHQSQACSCHTWKVPKMDWTVDDRLYHRFLNLNILECELAALPQWQQCKKVIDWSRDFGMDQYVSLCLPAEELNLETIRGKFEEFFKPQSNEMRAHFDFLTSFIQGNRSVDEWCIMWCKLKST